MNLHIEYTKREGRIGFTVATVMPLNMFFCDESSGRMSQSEFLSRWPMEEGFEFAINTSLPLDRWQQSFQQPTSTSVIETKLSKNRVYSVAARSVQGEIVVYASCVVRLSQQSAGVPVLMEMRVRPDGASVIVRGLRLAWMQTAVERAVRGILCS
jgi:hypothetical protein